MNILWRPSPNFNQRPKGVAIESVVIHYSAMACVEDVIAHFQNPESRVSAHYTICRKGRIYQHVRLEDRAWHAGKSRLGCRSEFNHFSVGVELYNPGHNRGYIPYTDEQINSLLWLLHKLYEVFPIRPDLVVGHEDIAPDRKRDPGELFPWDRLVAEGLAVRPALVA